MGTAAGEYRRQRSSKGGIFVGVYFYFYVCMCVCGVCVGGGGGGYYLASYVVSLSFFITLPEFLPRFMSYR